MVLRQLGSALAAVLAAVAVGLCPTPCRATVHVVPQPLIVKLDPSGKELVISPTFMFAASSEPSATLTAAVGRFDALVGCTAALQLSLDGQRIKSSGGLCLGVDGCDYTARDSAFVLQVCGTGGGCGGANQLWAVVPYHAPPAPPPPAPPPPPASPNPVCAGTALPHTNADCSLNGKVTWSRVGQRRLGKCVCDPPWTGHCCGTRLKTRVMPVQEAAAAAAAAAGV